MPTKTPQSLDGVRVVDFTRVVSGPFAAQILGDLGADVIKIETPGSGDESRLDLGASKIVEMPAGFVSYNRNKRSIALNLKSAAGKEIAQRLVRGADVVIHNFRTGVMERLGFGYDAVSAVNPSVVYCSVSAFGSDSALARKAANDIVIQANSGLMSVNGHAGQPPIRSQGYPSDITSGIYAAVGVLAALCHRQKTGEGQFVEVSMMGAVLSTLARHYGDYFANGHVPMPMGNGTDLGVPNGAFRTKDGWITLAAITDERWRATCKALGIERYMDDPRFKEREARRANREAVTGVIEEATGRLTRQQAEKALEAAGLSVSQVLTVPEVAADPNNQLCFVDVPVEGERTRRNIASPLKLSKTPVRVSKAVPRVGGNGVEILMEVGYTEQQAMEILAAASARTAGGD